MKYKLNIFLLMLLPLTCIAQIQTAPVVISSETPEETAKNDSGYMDNIGNNLLVKSSANIRYPCLPISDKKQFFLGNRTNEIKILNRFLSVVYNVAAHDDTFSWNTKRGLLILQLKKGFAKNEKSKNAGTMDYRTLTFLKSCEPKKVKNPETLVTVLHIPPFEKWISPGEKLYFGKSMDQEHYFTVATSTKFPVTNTVDVQYTSFNSAPNFKDTFYVFSFGKGFTSTQFRDYKKIITIVDVDNVSKKIKIRYEKDDSEYSLAP